MIKNDRVDLTENLDFGRSINENIPIFFDTLFGFGNIDSDENYYLFFDPVFKFNYFWFNVDQFEENNNSCVRCGKFIFPWKSYDGLCEKCRKETTDETTKSIPWK